MRSVAFTPLLNPRADVSYQVVAGPVLGYRTAYYALFPGVRLETVGFRLVLA